MKKNKNLKMALNIAYDEPDVEVVEAIMNSKEFKNLKKVLDSGYVTTYVGYLSDRELISKIFYYSGRALQDGNYYQQDDFMSLHFLILEYANRYGDR